jgi:hypothetical protein
MGGLQCIGKLLRDRQCLAQRQRIFLQPLGQRLPGNVFHRQARPSTFGLERVHGGDIWMVQGCDQAGFVAELLDAVRTAGRLFREHFERDIPRQARIVGQVDLTHATASKQSAYFIRTNLCRYSAHRHA